MEDNVSRRPTCSRFARLHYGDATDSWGERVFGLSRQERADRICETLQRQIFRDAFSLTHPLEEMERPWTDETRIWMLAEIIAFLLHCLGRYAIRGPDLTFRRRVQQESGYAEIAAIADFAREFYDKPFVGLEDKIGELFYKREREYLRLPLVLEDRGDPNQVPQIAAENVMRAINLPLDDIEARSFMAKVMLDTARLDYLGKQVDKIARLLGVPDTAPPLPGD